MSSRQEPSCAAVDSSEPENAYSDFFNIGGKLHNSAGCVTNIQYAGSGFSENSGFSWNDRYQLTSVSTNGAVAETYGYDVLGNRVSSSNNATGAIYHLYDGAQCIADLDSTGGVIRAYTWGPGIDNLLAMTVYTGEVARTYYMITDHLGSVAAVVDSGGLIVESYKFDAWGRVLGVFDAAGLPLTSDLGLPTSAIENRFLWQGREYSWETGLYNFRARWYDPITGRWLSNDPIGISGGLNQYVFCEDSPVMGRDPWGLCKEDDDISNLRGVLGLSDDVAITRSDLFGTPLYTVQQSWWQRLLFGPQIFNADGSSALITGTPPAWLTPGGGGAYLVGPASASRGAHIFRSVTGHVNPSTVASRGRFMRLFQRVAANQANANAGVVTSTQAARQGVQGYSQVFRNGEQVWVTTQNGNVLNAGVNAAGAVR